MSQLPAIVVKNSNVCTPSTASKLAGITVTNPAACVPSTTKKIAGIKVTNSCASDCNDSGDMLIDESYDVIGYYYRELTYVYDISTNNYPATYWIDVDNNRECVGENIANEAALLVALNLMGLGTWTVEGDDLTVVGYHQYADMSSTEQSGTVTLMSVDTDSPVDMPNMFMSTGFDLSIENTLVGNTALIEPIDDLNLGALFWPTGAVLNWVHYPATTGDGWNSTSADAVARGKDYTTQQSGDLYNGGVPYGRDFFEEFLYLANQTGRRRLGLGINIILPLIPYSNDLIDWTAMDLTGLLTEFDNMMAKVVAANAANEVIILEFGMELKTGAFADLTANSDGFTTGAENTKAEVLARLLTHTNASSAISIIDYIKAALPEVIISMDGKLWDDLTGSDSDMQVVLSAVPGVDAMRNYFQYQDADGLTYAAARAKFATRNLFWDWVEDADNNGKGTLISQLTVKASAPIRATVANGLLIAENYLVLSEENLSHSNKLKGIVHMNLKQLFDFNDNYALKPQYHFMKLLGMFFDNTQQKITVTTSNTALNNNCILRGVLVAGEVRVAILNPTATEYTLDGLNIDGIISTGYTATVRYSVDDTDPVTEDSTEVEESQLRFRPYSLTIVIQPGA